MRTILADFFSLISIPSVSPSTQPAWSISFALRSESKRQVPSRSDRRSRSPLRDRERHPPHRRVALFVVRVGRPAHTVIPTARVFVVVDGCPDIALVGDAVCGLRLQHGTAACHNNNGGI